MWPFEEIIANPIPVIIGFLTIATAFYISSKNKKLKSFRYEILTYEPILTSSEELRGKIKIYYETNQNNNIQIKDGFLFIIRLVNDGNVPIKSDDFYEPVSISFGSHSEVLSAEIIETNPRALNAELDTSRSKHKIYIKPLLLNQQDSITIKVLLTGFKSSEVSSIKVDARIVDVPEVKAIDGKRNYLKWSISKNHFLYIYSAFVVGLAAVVLFHYLPSSDFGLNANFITAQAGEDADVSILVEHEPISSFLMNHSGFIKASFPDYERQPNITLNVEPNSFKSVPAAAKMKIHIGQNVKAGMYRIELSVIQGFTQKSRIIFLDVYENKKNASNPESETISQIPVMTNRRNV